MHGESTNLKNKKEHIFQSSEPWVPTSEAYFKNASKRNSKEKLAVISISTHYLVNP